MAENPGQPVYPASAQGQIKREMKKMTRKRKQKPFFEDRIRLIGGIMTPLMMSCVDYIVAPGYMAHNLRSMSRGSMTLLIMRVMCAE
jgi:hypothetical protein